MALSAVRRLDATGVPLLLARLVVGLYFMHSGIVKIFADEPPGESGGSPPPIPDEGPESA